MKPIISILIGLLLDIFSVTGQNNLENPMVKNKNKQINHVSLVPFHDRVKPVPKENESCVHLPINGKATTSLYVRDRRNFNKGWKFHLGNPAGVPESRSYDDSSWKDVSLPHTHKVYPRWPIMGCWEWEDREWEDIWNRTRYVGWYRKNFEIPLDWDSRKVFIHFEGAMQVTDVWVNGNYVGQHAISGYNPFHFDITDYLDFGKSNVIVVKNDNAENRNIPPDGAKRDYTLFGGLYRDVYLVVTGKMYIPFPWVSRIAGVFVTTPFVSTTLATVKVKTAVKNEYPFSSNCIVHTLIIDNEGNSLGEIKSSGTIDSGKTHLFSQSLNIKQPGLWSPSNPNLYKAYIQVIKDSLPVDDYLVRFGIREYRFDNEMGFMLNGEPMKLIGANRHQTYPYVGNAVTNRYHYFDAKMMRDAGFDFFRGCHYPHDPAFLDACDELGMAVLEEPPTWGAVPNQIWWDNCQEAFRRMIRRDRNHPAIILWNACVNHGKCHPDLEVIAREEDPTRTIAACDIPAPMSSKLSEGGICIEHCSSYPLKDYEPSMRRRAHCWLSMIDAVRQSATSIIAGWSMFDYNSQACNRQTFGIADLHRIPRFGYYANQAELTDEPMVFIADYWNGLEEEDLTVFSNCEEVEIYVNDRHVVKGSPGFSDWDYLDHPPFRFPEVIYEPGKITAKGLIGGEVKAIHTRQTPGLPSAIKLESDYSELLADGSDFTRIVISIVDENGTVVPTETVRIPLRSGKSYSRYPAENAPSLIFKVSGVGELVGETNYHFPDHRIRVENGWNMVLARSPIPGTMVVTVSSPGLASDSIIIKFIPVNSSDL
ncbi:glycoside hydrolase family 2 TIM barrel-domain containing protein [Bacteroidota bacterium]